MDSTLRELFKRCPSLEELVHADTEEKFDDFLENRFGECIEAMEENANFLVDDGEEKLSFFLKISLSTFGVFVTQETYSKGHVDLTISLKSSTNPFKRLVEAKIYNGPSYHTEAINQLVNRYSTGRQPTGYIVEYIKRQGIAGIVKRLRKYADDNLPVNQTGKTSDHSINWTYVSNHRHSSGETLRVVHFNVNLGI